MRKIILLHIIEKKKYPLVTVERTLSKTLSEKLHEIIVLAFNKPWKNYCFADSLKGKVYMALADTADMNPNLTNGNKVI